MTDFADAEDVIDLTQLTGITSFDNLTLSQDGNDVVIDLSGQGAGSLTLRNVTLSDLDGDDFVFYEAPPDNSPQDSI